VRNILIELGFLEGEKLLRRDPVYCPASMWLRTTGGGLLEPRFRLFDRVKKGSELAVALDLFGERIRSYRAPYDGIVIGMAANPVSVPGTRFCHFGRLDG
jgi:predicted deacylase